MFHKSVKAKNPPLDTNNPIFYLSQKEALAQIRYGLYFEVLLPRYFGEILLFHQEQGFYGIYFC